MHIFHNWGRWSEPFDSNSASEKKCQARKCETCGKVHVAYVRSPWNWWFSAKQAIDALQEKK